MNINIIKTKMSAKIYKLLKFENYHKFSEFSNSFYTIFISLINTKNKTVKTSFPVFIYNQIMFHFYSSLK